jgi:hypothetical protein
MNAIINITPAALGIQVGSALVRSKATSVLEARHRTRQQQITLQQEVSDEEQRQIRLRIYLESLNTQIESLMRCLPGTTGPTRRALLHDLHRLTQKERALLHAASQH